MARSVQFALIVLLALAGCGDGASGDDVDAGADAGEACILPVEPIACTDNPECEAVCGGAYCREFGQLGELFCTNDCDGVNQCPAGWTCNMMGRCRPPGATDSF